MLQTRTKVLNNELDQVSPEVLPMVSEIHSATHKSTDQNKRLPDPGFLTLSWE
jgi:hypothetical protein